MMKDSGCGEKKEEEGSGFRKERIDLRMQHEIINIPKCLEGQQKNPWVWLAGVGTDIVAVSSVYKATRQNREKLRQAVLFRRFLL